MTPLLRKFLGIHWILVVPIVALMAFGILCVYTAVHFRDGEFAHLADRWNDQMRWCMVGIGVLIATALVDYKWIKWGALPLYCVGLGLMGLLLVKGDIVHGQKVAVTIAGIRFQPAQVAILSTILLLALVLGEGSKLIPLLQKHFVRLLVATIIFAAPFLLILKAKDLGSALVLIPVFAVMLLGSGMLLRYLIAGALLGLIAAPAVFFLALQDYQQDRITVPYKIILGEKVNVKDEAYALNNNLIAIGSSGWEGKGYEPDQVPDNTKSQTFLGLVSKETAHTDYIFTVLAEAFGFRGAALLIMVLLFIMLMSLTVALFSRDALGRVLVIGIVGLFFAHAFEHIGMNIGILPITGIPLPLVSYGGTFVLVIMFLFGLIQSVWVHRNKVIEEPEAAKQNRQGVRTAPTPMAYAG